MLYTHTRIPLPHLFSSPVLRIKYSIHLTKPMQQEPRKEAAKTWLGETLRKNLTDLKLNKKKELLWLLGWNLSQGEKFLLDKTMLQAIAFATFYIQYQHALLDFKLPSWARHTHTRPSLAWWDWRCGLSVPLWSERERKVLKSREEDSQ